MQKPIFDVIEFNCKMCGQIVWINNDTREIIKNEFTGEHYKKDYGLCRSCFTKIGSPPEVKKEITPSKKETINCFDTCPWKGRCLKGTQFDDGKGGLIVGLFAPWIDFSGYSPCLLIHPWNIKETKGSNEE